MPPGMQIPDRQDLGDLSKLQAGQLLDFVVQEHNSQRAGLHQDVRFGNPELGLYSWATRKGLPAPGKSHALFQQPVHAHAYGDFQGTLQGPGAGEVRQKTKGQITLDKVSPTKIVFRHTDATGQEQSYALVKPQLFGAKQWLLVNTTKQIPAGKFEAGAPAVKEEAGNLKQAVSSASLLSSLGMRHLARPPRKKRPVSEENERPQLRTARNLREAFKELAERQKFGDAEVGWAIIKSAADETDKVWTVAVDLDGTIAKNLPTFHPKKIGEPRRGVRKALEAFRELGWRIIIFTVRGNVKLLKQYLAKHELPYDYINENPDQPPDASGKVIADLYIDDRGLDATQPWFKIVEEAKAREKAASPFVLQALRAQLAQPSWDFQRGLLGNLLANAGEVFRRGQTFVDQARAVQDMQTTTPQARTQRFLQDLRGNDSVVTHPVDQALFTRRAWWL